MSIFGHYARYYDLLYRSKNYATEVEYVDHLLRCHAPGATSILEFGCGTGVHATLLAQAGYSVHGIDQSDVMLEQARARLIQMPEAVAARLQFSQGDIRYVRLDQQFDAIVSLFHVMSYQITNQDLQDVFKAAAFHLKPGGIFLFDCWYGPGVLSDRPTARIKRLEDDAIQVTRFAEPTMYANENRVDVNYQIYIKDQISGTIEELQECHSMRYLFTPELTELLAQAGMIFVNSYHDLTEKPPDFNSWNAYFIGRSASL